jgi:cellulose synthase/poly-beta-1,6-N-acetylglucosamine synthase-like glycosyltransferase
VLISASVTCYIRGLMKKTSQLYRLIIAAWAGLIVLAVVPLVDVIKNSENYGTLVVCLVTISTLFIMYFWLNGVKDVVYTFYFYIHRKKFNLPPLGEWRKRNGNIASKKIVAVYCTYNDFNGESLAACMNQDYPNITYVILDDSSDPVYHKIVDDFAQTHDLEVVRRKDREGYKAGNLNNYLRKANYDFFIILDSDEIIPPYFVTRCLDYFAYYANAGIVQANHVATRNRNRFMNLFSIGVDSHWPTYQTVKHYHGFLSLLGHGAMISKECYEVAGGSSRTWWPKISA